MSSTALMKEFDVLEDTVPDDNSLPAFMVSTKRGFLPRMDPIICLPSDFRPIEDLLQEMPIQKADGSAGLLAGYKLGEAVETRLPELTHLIEEHKDNLPLMNALYRDYSFLASAYLLEPCHERHVKGEGYGLARDVLPKQIARPMAKCADICGFRPWMEYAGSYALFNWRLDDASQGMTYSNLRLIRAFENGLDPTSSEAGFVLVHVDMAKESGALVAGTMACLDALGDGFNEQQAASPCPRRGQFNDGLQQVFGGMQRVNEAMETMWMRSKPGQYTQFRTFIFGITSQSMFPRGVRYEGVVWNDDDGHGHGDGEEAPRSFRGESGANDSMVPLLDSLLQVPMPDTPLTDILRDFRRYRPSNHREFLRWVADAADILGTRDFALGRNKAGGRGAADDDDDDEKVGETCILWLKLLDQVREFRWRHWCFAREYILKMTSHPTATGGSPIVTWLPNQLEAVLAEMETVYREATEELAVDLGQECRNLMDLVSRQKAMLAKEVAKYCAERGLAV